MTDDVARAASTEVDEQVKAAMASLAPRRIPKQERSRRTFEAILEAAGDHLVEEGPDSLTLDAVAERAGLSVGAVYGFFPNKYAVVNALAGRTLGRFNQVFASAVVPLGSTVTDQVMAEIDAVAELWMDPVSIAVWYTMQSTREMRVALSAYDDAFAEQLAQRLELLLPGMQMPEVRQVSAVICATIVALLDLSLRHTRDRRNIVEQMRRVVLSYLRSLGAVDPESAP